MTIDHRKNKLRTPGYFIKRLKDNGFVTFRMFDKYNIADPLNKILKKKSSLNVAST